MHRISLAEQITQLQDAAPVDFDPEGEVTDHEDTIGARDHYIDVQPSALRKLQDSIADPKYNGVKTSRKHLFDDHSGDCGSEEDHNDGQRHEHEVELPTPSEDPKHTENLVSTLRKTRDEDRKKGKAVSKQIALWDTLLDARIRLQKTVSAGNRLPSLFHHADSDHVRPSLTKMLAEAQLLSDQLFDLQDELLSINEEIAHPPRKRRKTGQVTSLQDFASEFREATQIAACVEHIFHPHLIQTLNKWSSKIQAVAPSVLLPSNRNAFSKPSQGLKSAAQLVDETLMDHDKVIQRTRIYRGKGPRIGAEKGDGGENRGDPEVFDDTDFYQQLLRDVIDARGNGGSEDWMEIQKQKKAKKHVDTKASKGRKLRYETHEKIQNFMVPVATQSSWHDEQVDELFASLLGKGFKNSTQGADDVMEEGLSMREHDDAVMKGGFRVFG